MQVPEGQCSGGNSQWEGPKVRMCLDVFQDWQEAQCDEVQCDQGGVGSEIRMVLQEGQSM